MRFTPTCSGADRRRASWFRHPSPCQRAVCVSASKQPGRPGRAHGQPWSQSRGQDSPWGAGAWTCLPPPTLGPTVNTPRPPHPSRTAAPKGDAPAAAVLSFGASHTEGAQPRTHAAGRQWPDGKRGRVAALAPRDPMARPAIEGLRKRHPLPTSAPAWETSQTLAPGGRQDKGSPEEGRATSDGPLPPPGPPCIRPLGWGGVSHRTAGPTGSRDVTAPLPCPAVPNSVGTDTAPAPVKAAARTWARPPPARRPQCLGVDVEKRRPFPRGTRGPGTRGLQRPPSLRVPALNPPLSRDPHAPSLGRGHRLPRRAPGHRLHTVSETPNSDSKQAASPW